MKNNLAVVEAILDYIELHISDDGLNLDAIAEKMEYSKYHLHRLFTAVVGFPIHSYIKRRRLTEAARMIVYTKKPILEIALNSGYETQRSFSAGFKNMYGYSPGRYRKQGEFFPLQLKFDIHSREKLRGDKILKIEKIRSEEIYLAGYKASTGKGFHVIGRCFRKLHQNKQQIENRLDWDFLIGVNDYSSFQFGEDMVSFDYIAGAQVSDFRKLARGMGKFTLPKSDYIVFTFSGKNEDSMQSIVEYIYQEWFPSASCQFSDKNLYDFVKYGEKKDQNGISEIQYWVPVLLKDNR